MNNLSENLRILRTENKIKQTDIEKLLNVSQGRYSHYEKGDRIPDLDTLIKFADFYNVTLDKLIRKD